ncbi:MAG: hypothetical protein HON83_02225 [Candidatus Marinimicrobia bacterium]|jgi:hypothetical protein|nr:hypothetical protein [Candidatus Neomarinimicrobiota bacterium]
MDISSFIYNIITTTEVSIVLNAILWFMVAVLLLSLYAILTHKLIRLQELAPVILTVLGVFGTFVGITIGLIGFDTENIEAGVPVLLEGLKTAFVTSIAGMFSALVVKVTSVIPRKNREAIEGTIGPEQINSILSIQNRILENISHELIETRKAIKGDGDGTVVTQLKKIRIDLHDNFINSNKEHNERLNKIRKEFIDTRHTLKTAFEDIAKKLSEVGTKQLVEALKEVIEDFNRKLPEQFGENFARLDESVKKMLEWQQEYKSQIELLNKQFIKSTDAIKITEKSLGEIKDHTSAIPVYLKKQNTILDALNNEITKSESLLETYVVMRDKAAGALPEIENRLDLLIESLSEGANNVMEQHAVSVDNISLHIQSTMKDAQNQQSELLKQSDDFMQESLSQSTELIDKAVKNGYKLIDQFSDKVIFSTDEIKQGIKLAVNSIVSGSEEIKVKSAESAEKLTKAGELLSNSLINASGTMETTVTEMSFKLGNEISKIFKEHNDAADNLSKDLREINTRAADEVRQISNAQLESLDKAMEKELQRAMTRLGSDLVSITGKFVEDYTKLTNNMEEVIKRNNDFK